MRDKKLRFLVISGFVILASSAVAARLKEGQQIPPPATDKVKLDRTLELRVVPDLTGKAEGVEVAKILDKAGLRVGETTYSGSFSRSDNPESTSAAVALRLRRSYHPPARP